MPISNIGDYGNSIQPHVSLWVQFEIVIHVTRSIACSELYRFQPSPLDQPASGKQPPAPVKWKIILDDNRHNFEWKDLVMVVVAIVSTIFTMILTFGVLFTQISSNMSSPIFVSGSILKSNCIFNKPIGHIEHAFDSISLLHWKCNGGKSLRSFIYLSLKIHTANGLSNAHFHQKSVSLLNAFW